MWPRRWLAISLCGLIPLTPQDSPAAVPAGSKLQFNRDVQPILSANCLACHGPDTKSRQAGLRLDELAGAIESGAITPGAADKSELIRRIECAEEAEVMPPPEAKKSLTAEQKAILTRWINEGAQFQTHWSFTPPQKVTPPKGRDQHSNRSAIDEFVADELHREGLTPAREADRRTLIRRVTLDLTGLPPTAEQVQQFVEDDRADAYEILVDRLLANPAYGERMALDWLDAARYADTNGYSIDGGRHMWLWRDWVINAFNSNLPYDQFLVEQLAGDLLPNRTAAQLLATGFQRNNMVTHEGGTIPDENLVNYNADRMKTFGEAVLGLTLACAQCHDHKYDPISQREYYQLYSYFNTLSDVGIDGDAGNNPRPMVELPTVLKSAELPELQQQIAKFKARLAQPDPQVVAQWEDRERELLAQRGQNFQLHPVELLTISTSNMGDGFDIVDNVCVIKRPRDLIAFDVMFKIPTTTEPLTGLRVVFHQAPYAPGKGYGYGSLPGQPAPNDKAPGTFVVSALSFSTDQVPSDHVNLNRLQNFAGVTASSWLDTYPARDVLDMRGENGWSPDVRADQHPHLTATLAQPLSATETPYGNLQVGFGHRRSLVGANFEIFAITGSDDGSELPQDVIEILGLPRAQRTREQSQRLLDQFAAHAPEIEPLRVRLANAEERLATLTNKYPVMVMEESKTPRQTHILNRGDYAQPGEVVEHGVPAALPPLPANAPNNRLGLAQWTVMREQPLTARVAVNRIWRLFFGQGLVATPADFGSQGERPSHPELLDWLAVDFQQQSWNVKRLVKQIVTSQAYRQDSATTAEMLERDPANRLLARGSRFRLPAEFVRDAALSTSGLLVNWVGGPSVNPYSPGDLWREVSHFGDTPATSQTFVQDHGEKLYRRSLYTYWKRTAPPPSLSAFDAPNREICTVTRSATTTPLQSLVLLNDVQYVEAARAFAERILHTAGEDAARVEWAFRETLARDPDAVDVEVVQRLLARERKRYAADQVAARELLSAGESPRDQALDAAEHAAWTQVAALLLNLSETVTRN